MILTAVLIVRNEEALLPRALKSLAGVDRLLVVDTGSTDGTVAEAIDCGAVVAHFGWCDDFSAARNHASETAEALHPETDWLITIDADEYMEPGGIARLREVLAGTSRRAVFARLVSECGKCTHERIVAYRPGLRYAGRVHEAINEPADQSDVKVTYGYSPAHAADSDRVMRILLSIPLAERTARDLYYLAREYWYRRDYETSVQTWHDCLMASTWRPERADSWLMIARCQWLQNRGEQARQACANALMVNPDFREALLLMAEMSWPEQAAAWRRYAGAATNDGVLFVRCP